MYVRCMMVCAMFVTGCYLLITFLLLMCFFCDVLCTDACRLRDGGIRRGLDIGQRVSKIYMSRVGSVEDTVEVEWGGILGVEGSWE